ncbi:hypothetical protein [Candidatus Venteria ishoeyi]|uniref:Uncharacterized protein n=1 Tax=Candidatus Venteria ishoeyi TaxID=1899563 RepID=A0A1H6F5R8_9GAMM|nr:hypothetical protein [Candidatus Venteria ishoeyi]MDM8545831.1 hypothetical protein [Candidatus Venteria ishoeyi]SEH04903.1 Uncharacterised protein [Candidatus Venteria ishoeyi]
MVNFSIFNELSLPLQAHTAQANFINFFQLLVELKQHGFSKIRMSNDFKHYHILNTTNFPQFIGQQTDREFKTRLKSFIANTIITIETPIIKEQESAQFNHLNYCEYFYKNQATDGGLACGDIWNTVVVSFFTHAQWSTDNVVLNKETLKDDGCIEETLISVKHTSNCGHIKSHKNFFDAIEIENRLNITQDNFWDNRDSYFPKKIKFCPEIESQIKNLDKTIFQHAISLLRDIETNRKLITDFNYSGESTTVHTNPELRKIRLFTISGEKVFIENHIKSLPHGNRIYFIEQKSVIYIGYIGKHLKGKRDK